jgi:hypothetical protein
MEVRVSSHSTAPIGGIAIPLSHRRSDHSSHRLSIDLSVDRSRADHARLEIRFGPHVLEAEVIMRR